jgi:DNA modification methylase
MKPYYSEDGITLYHADCRELLHDLPGGAIVVSDPPYGISANSHRTGLQFTVAGDDGSCDEIVRDIEGWMPCVLFASPFRPWPGQWEALLVWDKGPGMGGNGDMRLWKRTWELIQVNLKGLGAVGSRDSAVLQFWKGPWHRVGCDEIHPTEKPLELMNYLVAKMPDGLIVDPFMGSGTTLRAAKDLGRKGVGIEIEERYCEIAAKRLAQKVLQF